MAHDGPGAPADDDVGAQPREVDGQQALRLGQVAAVRLGQRDGHRRERDLREAGSNDVSRCLVLWRRP